MYVRLLIEQHNSIFVHEISHNLEFVCQRIVVQQRPPMCLVPEYLRLRTSVSSPSRLISINFENFCQFLSIFFNSKYQRWSGAKVIFSTFSTITNFAYHLEMLLWPIDSLVISINSMNHLKIFMCRNLMLERCSIVSSNRATMFRRNCQLLRDYKWTVNLL